MKTNKIPRALLEDIQIAVRNIYRYERLERYALAIVLKAVEHNDDVEEVFVEQAKLALKHHPVKKSLIAA